MKTSIILFLMLFGGFPVRSQEPPNSSTPAVQDDKAAPVFHAGTSLVLVDVIAKDPKTLLPLNKVDKEDFRLFDNGNEVQISTFDSGYHYNTRPIALWFVVICNEKNNGPNGREASGLFFTRKRFFGQR